VNNLETIGTFKLFAELIATHLNAIDRLAQSETTLSSERKTSELREQFIAVLGHDLRNPLAAMAAGARMISKAKSLEDTAEVASLMQSSIGRMAQLIDNVLDFARGRLGGGLTLNRDGKEPVEQVLKQVVAELRSGHADKSIEARFQLTRPVNCDPQRIGQLFSNLLGNAITHGSPDKPIVACASTEDGMFELSVSNAGDPIPPDVMAQLFQPFYRGTLKRMQGLGLGLFIASEIGRAHGGTLDVKSSADETRFTFECLSPEQASLLAAGAAGNCPHRTASVSSRHFTPDFVTNRGNVRTLGSHSATPSGATARPFWATTTMLRSNTLRRVSSFKIADASPRVRVCSASLGVTVASSY
jgi:signal transduction histidine kinase